jgi:hypothetical protein
MKPCPQPLVPWLAAALAISVVAASLDGDVPARADDMDPFPQRIERAVGGRKVKLVRTGKAVRKQLGFKVYDVASYLAEGAKVKTAEELAASDQPKHLVLVFILSVPGDDMARAFESGLRRNYPEPAFAKEVEQLVDQVRKTTTKKGDRILMTHIPDKGLHYRFQGKDADEELLIPNPAFSKAVWDNYLGEHNCGENVKLGLVSEL